MFHAEDGEKKWVFQRVTGTLERGKGRTSVAREGFFEGVMSGDHWRVRIIQVCRRLKEEHSGQVRVSAKAQSRKKPGIHSARSL